MKRTKAGKIALFILIGAAAVVVFGGIVMLLWNNVLAQVVNVQPVTFWQALGILLLAKILFGGWKGGGSGRQHWKHKMQDKWAAMSPEERERFKEQWKKRCGPWSSFTPPNAPNTQQPTTE